VAGPILNGRIPGPADLANALIPGYGAPARIMPLWEPGYLVYKGGLPSLPRASLTGGGDIYPKDWSGRFKPIIHIFVSPTNSLLGGGLYPANFPTLQALGLNPSGNNTGN
jgi:hypothetical protein